MGQAPVAPPLQDVRCKACGSLLFRAAGLGRVEIVCAKRACRVWQAIRLGDRQ